jgi:hypothetical protein
MKKLHQATHENLQNSAGGFKCFADSHFRAGSNLDADYRPEHELGFHRLFGGRRQIGGCCGISNPVLAHRPALHLNQFGSHMDAKQPVCRSMGVHRLISGWQHTDSVGGNAFWRKCDLCFHKLGKYLGINQRLVGVKIRCLVGGWQQISGDGLGNLHFHQFGRQLDDNIFIALYSRGRHFAGGVEQINRYWRTTDFYFHQFGDNLGTSQHTRHKLDCSGILGRWFQTGGRGRRKP